MDELSKQVERVDVVFDYETFEFEVYLTTSVSRAKLMSYTIDDIKKLIADSICGTVANNLTS